MSKKTTNVDIKKKVTKQKIPTPISPVKIIRKNNKTAVKSDNSNSEDNKSSDKSSNSSKSSNNLKNSVKSSVKLSKPKAQIKSKSIPKSDIHTDTDNDSNTNTNINTVKSIKNNKNNKTIKINKTVKNKKEIKIKGSELIDKIDVDIDMDDLDEAGIQLALASKGEIDKNINKKEVKVVKKIKKIQTVYEMDDYEKARVNTDRHRDLIEILYATFGYESFKPEQYKIIDSILEGKDVLGVMPTGYGKSLCFQVPPLITKELSIVISPLIALMNDQVTSMSDVGINSACYNSTLSAKRKAELEKELIDGEYMILYVTPESLDKPEFKKMMMEVYKKIGICMVAVDEAHCVSSFGFDFRPKYREIVKIRSLLPNVPVLAVTATATEKVMKDIAACLKMNNSVQIKTSFDRPNLFINIKEIKQDSLDNIFNLIKNCDGPSIVYCLTKRDTDRINTQLNANGISSVSYHADLNKDTRTKNQTDFMSGKVNCICATIAFGMGINKANVRLVIHYGCPKNIESYYQEIGRAGRDGYDSECWLFYRQQDFRIQKLFIEKITDPIYKTTCTRLLYIMTKYITDKKCRRKELLKYFSEEYPRENCGKCDNCCVIQKSIPTKDEGDLFKLLSTVYELDATYKRSYGKNKLMLILRGSNSKDIQSWMKNMPYFGAFKSKSVKDSTRIIESALELGYMENVPMQDAITVIKCTEYGLKFGEEYENRLNKLTAKNKDIEIV